MWFGKNDDKWDDVPVFKRVVQKPKDLLLDPDAATLEAILLTEAVEFPPDSRDLGREGVRTAKSQE